MTLSTVRADDVQEGTIALYVQNTTHWTPWLRYDRRRPRRLVPCQGR